MTIKVKKVIESRPVTLKTGSVSTKTQFITEDGQSIWTWGQPSVGEELEGEIVETQYGKELKRVKPLQSSKQTKAISDPDTMLIAYAKDIVVAFINAGIITELGEAAKQWQNFSKYVFALYDKRKTLKSNS